MSSTREFLPFSSLSLPTIGTGWSSYSQDRLFALLLEQSAQFKQILLPPCMALGIPFLPWLLKSAPLHA